MIQYVLRKSLVLGIILLFLGASVVPSITGYNINIENNQKGNRTSKNLEGLGILGDAPKPIWDIGQTWWYKVNTLNFNQLGVSINANPFYLIFEVIEKTANSYKLSIEGDIAADMSLDIFGLTISGSLIDTKLEGLINIDNNDIGLINIKMSIDGIIDRGSIIQRYVPFNVEIEVEPKNVYNYFNFPISEGEIWSIPSEDFDSSILFKIKFLGIWFKIIDETVTGRIDAQTVECVGVETVNGVEAFHIKSKGDFWYSPSIENIVKLTGSYIGIEVDIDYCHQPFYFVHITDPHVVNEHDDHWNSILQTLSDMEPIPPDFVLCTGDIVDWGQGVDGNENYLEVIDDLYEENGIFFIDPDHTIPIYFCPGNHDGRQGEWDPSPPYIFDNYYNNIGPDYDTILHKTCRIFSMNSGADVWPWYAGDPFTPEGDGLDDKYSDELSNFVSDVADAAEEIKIVMGHHPYEGSNPYIPLDGAFINGRDAFIQACNNYDVDMVLCGHLHGENTIKTIGESTNQINTPAVKDGFYRKIYVGSYTIDSVEKFSSTISCDVSCRTNVHIYDEQNNHNGPNEIGEIEWQIPNSHYSNWEYDIDTTLTEFTLSKNDVKDYTIIIEGLSDENMNVSFFISSIGGNWIKAIYSNIIFYTGSVATMYANQSILDYTMIIEDSDGTVRKITPSEYEENIPPEKPYNLNGPVKGSPGETYTYSVETNDLNGDVVYYWFDWDDGKNSGWLGPYESGEIAETQYSWEDKGVYEIKVKAKDDFSLEGDWSDPLVVTIPRIKAINHLTLNFLQSHPNLFTLLQKLIQNLGQKF